MRVFVCVVARVRVNMSVCLCLCVCVCLCAAPVCGGGTVNLISCSLALTSCGRKQNAFGVSARATISPGLSCWCRPNTAEQSRAAAWDLKQEVGVCVT